MNDKKIIPRKVQWLCWQPTPYNDYLFRSISQEPEIDLTVYFREESLASHPWKSQMGQGFRWRLYQKKFGVDPQLVHAALKDRGSFFVIAGWDEPTCQIVINLLTLRRRPFAIWTDTPDLDVPRPWWKEYPRRLWLKEIFRSAKAVMGTGRPGIDALKAMGCPFHKLTSFPFYVDLTESEADYALKPGLDRGLTFLASGQLIKRKGYDLMIKAFGKQKDHAFPWRLFLAGDGPEKESLKRLAEEEGIIDRVNFMGWLEEKDMRELRSRSHVYIHPARNDPFPVAVLQAMASRLAVMGTLESGSVSDRVQSGVNGLTYEADNLVELSQCIALFLDCPEKATSMGKEARSTAEKWPVEEGVRTIKKIVGIG